MEDFKGNSHSQVNQKEAPEVIQPITTNVTVKKSSELSKFGKSIISEDANNVGRKLVSDVIVPGVKKLLADLGTNFVNWFIYGVKGAPVSKSNVSGLNRISYSSMFDRPAVSTTVQPKANLFTIDEVYFDDRGDAELVLLKLKERIGRYGMVSAGDFYQMVQQQYVFTAEKYGWRDLSSAEIVRRNDKYIISFPKLQPLE